MSTPAADPGLLLSDLRTFVQSARQRLASVANSTFTLLSWHVGRRHLRDELQSGRAVYGKQILATVSQELTAEFGAGFNDTALTCTARFAEWIPDCPATAAAVAPQIAPSDGARQGTRGPSIARSETRQMTRKNAKPDPIVGLLAELDDLQKRAALVHEPNVSDILQTC